MSSARLTAAALLPRGPLGRLGRPLLLVDQVDSTNAQLLARAAELPDGTVLCAECQSAGRGRLGRRWEAPRGASVLMSVLLREPRESPLPAQATMLAAVAACAAVESATTCSLAVRWPNDLFVQRRKLGGVLVEVITPPGWTGERALVIGIGLNCLQHRGHFPPALAESATSLELEVAAPVDRPAVARELLVALDRWLTVAARRGPELALAWRRRCGDYGARVQLAENGQSYAGTVVDIDEAGNLVVQLAEGGRRQFAAATTTRIS